MWAGGWLEQKWIIQRRQMGSARPCNCGALHSASSQWPGSHRHFDWQWLCVDLGTEHYAVNFLLVAKFGTEGVDNIFGRSSHL